MVNGRFDNQPVTPPVVWMPHGEISNSPSTPVVMEEGLFAGQLAIGDVTYGGVQRVFLEEVDGKLQGALYRMTQGLEAGINEVALGPDGDLYLGGIGYDGNWNQPGKLRYGLQKLRANDTVTMDILKTEITETGFKLTYTKPLSETTRANLAAKYQVQQWRYNPTAAYGGPKLDQESLAVEGATVSADGKTVSLTVRRRQARPRRAHPLPAAVQRGRRRAALEHRGLVHGERGPGLSVARRSGLLRGRGGHDPRRGRDRLRPQQVLRLRLRGQHDHASARESPSRSTPRRPGRSPCTCATPTARTRASRPSSSR